MKWYEYQPLRDDEVIISLVKSHMAEDQRQFLQPTPPGCDIHKWSVSPTMLL